LIWRSVAWARCLGWTIVLGGTCLASMFVVEQVGGDLFPWGWIAPLLVDGLIGTRVHEWWWVWGPMGVLLSLCVGAGAWMSIGVMRYEGPSYSSPKVAMGFFLGGVLVAFVVGCLVHAVPATVGVLWGKRGEGRG